MLATGLAPPGLLPLEQLLYKGHLVPTERAPVTLPAAITGPDVAITQLEDGRLLAGGDLVPDDGSAQVDPATIAVLRAGLARLLPSSAGLRLSHACSCIRGWT